MGSLPHGGRLCGVCGLATAHAVVVWTPSTLADYDPQFASGGHSVNSSLCHRIAGSSTTRIAKSTPPPAQPRAATTMENTEFAESPPPLRPGAWTSLRYSLNRRDSLGQKISMQRRQDAKWEIWHLGPTGLSKFVQFPREGEAPAEPLTRVDPSSGSRLSRSFALPAAHPQPRFLVGTFPLMQCGFEIGTEESAIPPSCSCP